MASTSNMYERTFVYSRQQMDDQIRIELNAGRPKPKFGMVNVNGVFKTYTEILPPGRESRYADARVLIKDDMRKIKYTKAE